MSNQIWRCKECNGTRGVENGNCSNCGPVQTIPVNDEAKKEAKVDDESMARAEKAFKEEELRAIEAEKRNSESIQASKRLKK